MIKLVREMKTLGINFSEDLYWNYHVNHVDKINKIDGLLNQHRHSLPTKIKIIVYNSLVFSTINYCHLVWDTTPLQNKQKLNIAQKTAITIIYGVPAFFHTKVYFVKFNSLEYSLLCNHTLIVTYKTAVGKYNIFS